MALKVQGETRVQGRGFALPPVAVTYVVAERCWELLEEYRYWDNMHGVQITIPAGFRFDLASTPRVLWRVIAPFELSIVAPLVHDVIYRHSGEPPESMVEPYRTYTRKEADQLFDRIMQVERVPA